MPSSHPFESASCRVLEWPASCWLGFTPVEDDSIDPPSLKWGMPHEDKSCQACGRTIQWRKKWAKNWDQVKWCSDRCKRQKVRPLDQKLEEVIEKLLQGREASKSICPSEAAKSVDPLNWRELLDPARSAARRLVTAGTHEITQKGQVVDPSRARGPIRIRRATCLD